MAEERLEVPLSDLLRWLVVAGLIIVGVVMYLVLAPSTPAVVTPASQEQLP